MFPQLQVRLKARHYPQSPISSLPFLIAIPDDQPGHSYFSILCSSPPSFFSLWKLSSYSHSAVLIQNRKQFLVSNDHYFSPTVGHDVQRIFLKWTHDAFFFKCESCSHKKAFNQITKEPKLFLMTEHNASLQLQLYLSSLSSIFDSDYSLRKAAKNIRQLLSSRLKCRWRLGPSRATPKPTPSLLTSATTFSPFQLSVLYSFILLDYVRELF